MSTEDRLAIHEMIARYSHAYDGLDADGFAQVFTEDGVFEIVPHGHTSPAVRLPSREAIREWAAQRLRARAGRFTSRHHQSGILFDELAADHAVTRTIVLVTHQESAAGEPRPITSGVYRDRWRRTGQGWRLAHRAAHIDGDLESLK